MKFITKTQEETINLAYSLTKFLTKGDCLLLQGDLAGGKTTFTKGVGKALNIQAVINSPTFNILKIYHGDYDLYHIDAYRLEGSEYDLGFDDFLEDGIMVVEWPEYFKDYLPDEYLILNFTYIDENTRAIEIEAKGERFEKILKEFNDAYTMS